MVVLSFQGASNLGRRLLFDMLENTEDVSSMFLSQFTSTMIKEDKPRPLSTFLNPSSLKCPRQACFKGLGYETDNTIRSINGIGITSVGSFLHEFTQNVLTKMPDWKFIDVADFVKGMDDLTVLGKSDFETKLESKQYRVHFLVDGVMKHKSKDYLIEIKTMTSKKYYALKDIGEYKMQIVSYATLLGLSDVLLIAIDRDLLNYKVISYHVTRHDKNEWKQMMGKILSAIDSGEVLPIPDGIEKRVCAYCPFKGACNNE